MGRLQKKNVKKGLVDVTSQSTVEIHRACSDPLEHEKMSIFMGTLFSHESLNVVDGLII